MFREALSLSFARMIFASHLMRRPEWTSLISQVFMVGDGSFELLSSIARRILRVSRAFDISDDSEIVMPAAAIAPDTAIVKAKYFQTFD